MAKGSLIGVAWVVLGVVLVCGSQVFGETYTFAVASGSWWEENDWVPNDGPPLGADDAIIANGGAVSFGSLPVGPGSVTLEDGSMEGTDGFAITIDQGGTFIQTGGSLSVPHLTVGSGGTGTFIQTGGLVTVAYRLAIAAAPNADGTYDLGGQTLEFGTRLDIGANDGRGGNGTLVVDGGTITGTDYIYDSEIWVNGNEASLTGPGTYDAKVRYSSDWIYGNGKQPVWINFERRRLTVGGQFSVTDIDKDEFAGGMAAQLLEPSIFDIGFDGLFLENFTFALPYDEQAFIARGITNFGNVRVIQETGSDTYEILPVPQPDTAFDYFYLDCNEFGKYALQAWDPNVKLIDKPCLKRNRRLGLLQDRSLSEAELWDFRCVGACADGETKVVLCIDFNTPALDVENPDWVTITVLTTDDLDNGHMIVEGQDDDGDSYDDTPRISEGVFTQSWCVPEIFDNLAGSQNTLSTRDISIKIEYDPDKDGDVDYERTVVVKLARPPVLLVHGLWSDSSAFREMYEHLYYFKGFRFVDRADYSYTNSAHFVTNDQVVEKRIRGIFSYDLRLHRYAGMKVDVIGHSMGGVLMKRMGVTNAKFARENVRKMITIGSPYKGSAMADKLYELTPKDPVLFALIDGLLKGVMKISSSPLLGGAVEDLRVGANDTSTQIAGVDCEHVVAGLRNYSTDSRLDVFMIIARLATQKFAAEEAHDEIFGEGTGSDWLVSVDSQLGGASSPAPIPVKWHCTEAFDQGFKANVVEWLNQPAVAAGAGAAASSGQQAVTSVQQDSILMGMPQRQYSLNSYEPSGTIEIVSPVEGQTLEAGGTLSINVQGTGDTVKGALFGFFGSDSGGGVFDLPFVMDINLPDDAVGSAAKLMAVGLDANMVVTDQAEVNLIWDANVVLEDIVFGFGEAVAFDLMMYPDANHTLMLGPIGRFDNGEEHMLSVLAGAPNYVSSDETVAAVDANGLLVARGKGQCEITVTHSGINAVVTVQVNTYWGDVFLDGRVDLRDFTLLGSSWEQSGGGLLADIWPEGGDDVVDMLDLRRMYENWLAGVK